MSIPQSLSRRACSTLDDVSTRVVAAAAMSLCGDRMARGREAPARSLEAWGWCYRCRPSDPQAPGIPSATWYLVTASPGTSVLAAETNGTDAVALIVAIPEKCLGGFPAK